MMQTPTLPVEILLDIFGYLQPSNPVIGQDAAWSPPAQLRNWWDRIPPIIDEEESPESESGDRPLDTQSPKGRHPYADLFVLRQ